MTDQPQSADSRDRKILFFIFLSAAALRTAYLYQNLPNPFYYQPVLDETYYMGLGKAVASGFWLGERRVFFMDPLYGYFLAFIFFPAGLISKVLGLRLGDEMLMMIVRLAQILLDSALVYLIYRVGVLTWGRLAGLLAAGFWACYKTAFFFSMLLLKSTLSVFLLLAYMIILIRAGEEDRPGGWVKTGLMTGALTFTHANLLLMAPLGLLAWLGVKRPGWKSFATASALVAVGLLLVLTIGAARNKAAAGEWIFLNSQGGRLLYASNNPENLTGLFRTPSFSRKGPESMDEDFHAEAQRRLGRKLTAGEVSRYWTGETVKFVMSEPGKEAQALWNKFIGSIGAFEIPVNRFMRTDARFSSIARAPLPDFAFALALGAPGLLLGMWRRRDALWLAAPVAAVGATLMIFYTCSRFRFPMVPFLLIGAGIFINILWDKLRERRWLHTLGMAGVAAGIFAVSISVPARDYPSDERFLLAKAYWGVGDHRAAMAIAEDGAKQYPGESRFPVIQGMAALSRNDFAAAESFNREALRLDPRDYDAMNNLGLALLGSGRPAEAVEWLSKSYQGGGKPITMFILGRALEAAGDKAGAVEAYRKFLEVEKPGSAYIPQAQERLGGLAAGE